MFFERFRLTKNSGTILPKYFLDRLTIKRFVRPSSTPGLILRYEAAIIIYFATSFANLIIQNSFIDTITNVKLIWNKRVL